VHLQQQAIDVLEELRGHDARLVRADWGKQRPHTRGVHREEVLELLGVE
jgi:hypothetical protein